MKAVVWFILGLLAALATVVVVGWQSGTCVDPGACTVFSVLTDTGQLLLAISLAGLTLFFGYRTARAARRNSAEN